MFEIAQVQLGDSRESQYQSHTERERHRKTRWEKRRPALFLIKKNC